jgi:UDPglucose--hexose-1-phosphate uridylyltransferase
MPSYKSTYVFVNDFSAVKEDQADYAPPPTGPSSLSSDPSSLSSDPSTFLLQARGVKGRCYVIAFSPSHNLTLADLPPHQILLVIETWTALYASHLPSTHPYFSPTPPEFGLSPPKEQYTYIQIFENKGAAMGCSNPHPHGQAWSTTGLPTEVFTELKNMTAYKSTHGGQGMLVDYVTLELQKRERVVFENATWVALCPWWAVWPFETMVVPKREVPSLPALTKLEQEGLAECIAQVTKRYDNMFETQFPYSMGLHQAPLEGDAEGAHLHLHFYPPLLRSATVRKFLVG